MEAGDSAVEQEPNSDSNLALDRFTGAGSCDVQDVVRRLTAELSGSVCAGCCETAHICAG